MTQFSPEETTKVDIPKPSVKSAVKADLCPVPATEGGVGKVTYEGNLAPAIEVKRPQGRPSKFTEENKSELLRLIEGGLPIRTACALVGVDTSTYQHWKAAGVREKEGEFADFFNHIARARAVAEKNLLERANRGDGREWSEGPSKSAKWVLERSFGKDYAPRLNMKLEELGDLILAAVERICSSKDCGCYAEIITAISDIETSSGETI